MISSTFNPAEQQRYQRQLMLLGDEAQSRLKKATVFIAGAGGLGCPVALYLGAAGIGRIVIADMDCVEMTNLNRQVLFDETTIGTEKSVAAKERIERLNPHIRVESITAKIDDSTAGAFAGNADIIVDATDNFQTRYSLNQVACRNEIPLVHGAVCGFHGQVATIIPGKTACFKCMFPHPPPPGPAPVIGTTAGIIGMIQANEVIKYITGRGSLITGQILLWDGLGSTIEYIPAERDPACSECSQFR